MSYPDIAFAVQRLSSYALKAPKAVLKGCSVVLAYLLGTKDLGLSYSAVTETWGVEGQLPFPQSLDGLRIETGRVAWAFRVPKSAVHVGVLAWLSGGVGLFKAGVDCLVRALQN